jgi:Flp pilus assembly protein TadG
MRLTHQGRQRRAATTVEFAFVALMLFMMLFAIFEYGRFLFVYHLTTNAARDAARFAVVHTSGGTMPGEPATITVDDVKEVWRTGMFNGTAYGSGMCGMESQITGYTVDVFAVPDASLYAATPDLNPSGKPVWTSATFHQQIAVRVSGTYKPVVPSLIGLSSDVPFTVIVLMGSEAN